MPLDALSQYESDASVNLLSGIKKRLRMRLILIHEDGRLLLDRSIHSQSRIPNCMFQVAYFGRRASSQNYQLYNVIGPFPSIDDPSIPISVVRSMQPRPDEWNSFPGVNKAEAMEGVRKSRIEIPVRNGVKIFAVLYQPASAPEAGSPLIVAYHGGGWCMGVPEQEEVNW